MSDDFRILVVEDEFIVAHDIKQRLIDLKFQPIGHAASGEDAMQLADKLRPDLILTDIGLAGAMDGVDVALAARQRFNIPTIFVSASITVEVKNRAASAVPLGFIDKPMSDWDFVEVMQAWRVQALRSNQSHSKEVMVAV